MNFTQYRCLILITTVSASILGFSSNAEAQNKKQRLRVVTTLPYLKSLVEIIGADRVQVQALAKANQDPHRVTPTPALMSRLNSADVFIENGLSLELWSERVLNGARNSRIRVGQRGHLYAATKGVVPLQIPGVVSRMQGDIHPQGNPHVHLDPLNGKAIAANIAAHLEKLDPAGAKLFQANLKKFNAEIDKRLFGEKLVKFMGGRLLTRLHRSGRLISFLKKNKMLAKLGGWLAKAEKIRGKKVVSWHLTWAYAEKSFGFQVIGYIEPKPGVPPTPPHLSSLYVKAKKAGASAVILASYFSHSRAKTVAAKLATGMAVLPVDCGLEGIKDYYQLFDVLLERLAKAVDGKIVIGTAKKG
jgi:zinc/manganese transport system substrate-binding protein